MRPTEGSATSYAHAPLAPRYTRFLLFLLAGLALSKPASAQLPPIGDSFTNAAQATANFGGNVNLKLDGSVTKRVYIQFDLSGLPAGSVGSQVSKATLVLFPNTVNSPRHVRPVSNHIVLE